MAKRKIIKIDANKCNGCGLCIPNCPEGALQVIDGKARLISDLFCDGLGACIGHCPQGAIDIEERDAEPYDERRVMENIVKQGKNVAIAHLKHLKEHGEAGYMRNALDFLKEKGIDMPLEELDKELHGHGSCPGSSVVDLRDRPRSGSAPKGRTGQETELRNWPVQLTLVPAHATYFKDADLLIAADCVPFAYANFHNAFLRDKILLVGCPKLDDAGQYAEKMTQIFKENDIKSVTGVHMEVPCCFGLTAIIKKALAGSGKKIHYEDKIISIKGEVLK